MRVEPFNLSSSYFGMIASEKPSLVSVQFLVLPLRLVLDELKCDAHCFRELPVFER
jgi:hypothetical protein